ncbi:MAG: DnaD domain protein, partial [Clostridia bacterium]|nr:DnaD domain protein [Clostridia bacterium]
MFGFDERYAMFDITPVENQFILDYLPDAKGDYVKVYLYGLMRCYHPEEDMSLARMCHELNMTEEDVAAAFRYWERRRLVRRISDNPPQWKYVNIKQKNLVSDDENDPEYEDFSNAVYEAFDKVRRLHGSELSACFEWHEGLKLPTEVIIMLLNHMVEVKGKNFRISDAEKTAVQMASEKIMSVDAAEEFFSRDEKAYAGIKKILKKMGKRYLPSEAQVALYRKWTREWGFSHEAVEAALELTAKGDPSLGYLDGILNSLKQENPDAAEMTPDTIRHSARRAEGLREVLKELGKGEVNPRNLQTYDRMTELYAQEIILTAARECGHNGKDT